MEEIKPATWQINGLPCSNQLRYRVTRQLIGWFQVFNLSCHGSSRSGYQAGMFDGEYASVQETVAVLWLQIGHPWLCNQFITHTYGINICWLKEGQRRASGTARSQTTPGHALHTFVYCAHICRSMCQNYSCDSRLTAFQKLSQEQSE